MEANKGSQVAQGNTTPHLLGVFVNFFFSVWNGCLFLGKQAISAKLHPITNKLI